ncbi:Thioredoxin reductase [Quaeritorhiza haematococci]|nr:Thioredoxin reductase [Quaeritorhiza haematococci]
MPETGKANTPCQPPPTNSQYDVIIVGGGTAGLSAALLLARCRRQTLVIDKGEYFTRNAPYVHQMHAFPSRDGISPDEFLRCVRREVFGEKYGGYVRGLVGDAARGEKGYEVFSVCWIEDRKVFRVMAAQTEEGPTCGICPNDTGGGSSTDGQEDHSPDNSPMSTLATQNTDMDQHAEYVDKCQATDSKGNESVLMQTEGDAIANRIRKEGRSTFTYFCRKIILATGVIDLLPEIPGFSSLYGRGVLPCPVCDGFENQNRRTAVYGEGDRGYELALEMKLWTSDIVLCTNGPSELNPKQLQNLKKHGIRLREERIARLESGDCEEGEEDSKAKCWIRRIVFEDGSNNAGDETIDVLYFNTGRKQRSSLPQKFCALTERQDVDVNEHGKSSVPGLYVVGNATNDYLQLAVTAAAMAIKAAFSINSELVQEDFGI